MRAPGDLSLPEQRSDATTATAAAEWSIERAAQYYNVAGWGAGFFSVNDKGHMVVHPMGQPGPTIDLMDVVEDIQERKIGFPCLVRFQDILRARVKQINEAFARAVAEMGYAGRYYGVFPVKVNQMREVVEEILDAGAPYHHGLEAGSKGELLIVLGMNADPDALTICNGYKDEEFLRLALLGRKLGRKVLVVIEKLSELPHLLKLAEEMQVEPLIGLRSKLTTRGTGKWEGSSGDFAKFGLTIPELIHAVRLLKEAGKEHCAKLLHFHVGSQLTEIRVVKDAVNEGARVYAKLRKMGLPIEYFDVGGGLGVDYVGTHSNGYSSSVNYSMDEYVGDIIYNIQRICLNEGVPEPNIVSESGRAAVAHHSCIIMNVFGHIEIGSAEEIAAASVAQPNEPKVVREMREVVASMTPRNRAEAYHDAAAKKEEALQMFKLGILGLEERAAVESLFWTLVRGHRRPEPRQEAAPPGDQGPGRQDRRPVHGQLLPLPERAGPLGLRSAVPHRAAAPAGRGARRATPPSWTSPATRTGRSTGSSKARGWTRRFPCTRSAPDEPYYLGMFMTGAYQDIMGDMHNLFGRVNEIHLFVDDEDPEDFYIEETIPGDTVAKVLSRVQYEPNDLFRRVKNALDQKIKEGVIRPKEGVSLQDFYESVMRGYTYLGV